MASQSFTLSFVNYLFIRIPFINFKNLQILTSAKHFFLNCAFLDLEHLFLLYFSYLMMFGMVLFIYLKIILIFLSLPQSFDSLCCMELIAKQIGITYCACKDIAAAGQQRSIVVAFGRRWLLDGVGFVDRFGLQTH